MPYIIKSPEELKDPFLCFCIFQRFCEEAGEDYIDYNETIVNAYPFAMWLFGKGYIDNITIEKICSENNLSIQDILKGEFLFPNTYGEGEFSNLKTYLLLAEYMSSISEFRERLYDSVNDKAFNFENDEFYKNDMGISLACIIPDEEMVDTELDQKENLNKCNVSQLSYKEQWRIVTSMTISETDNFDRK